MAKKTKNPCFATTLSQPWQGKAKTIENLPFIGSQPHTLMDEFYLIFLILNASRKECALLLNSTQGDIFPDILACVLLGFVPKRFRPKIALMGAMWQPNTGLRGTVERIIIKLADRAIDRYIVQSTEELTVFPQTWGVSEEKMRLCPYRYNAADEKLTDEPPPPEDFIFAGGNSLRDYRPLVEAARQLPEYQFIIATKKLHQIVDPPPNVTAGPVTHDEFVRLMRAAAVVVIPMEQNLKRAAGQQTYLNAMFLRKPTIVNNIFGVHDHIIPGENGMIVDGTPQSYVEAIRWVKNPANAEALQKMGDAGYETVIEKFQPKHFTACLTEHMFELAGCVDD